MLLLASLVRKTLAYLVAGGPLMLPIVLVAFAIWLNYLMGYLRLRRLRGSGLGHTTAIEEACSSLDILRVLVAVAPLLGLLGTVLGIVGTFRAMGNGGPEMTERFAEGLQVALFTTQAGLMAALPGIAALAHLGHLFRSLQAKQQGTGQ